MLDLSYSCNNCSSLLPESYSTQDMWRINAKEGVTDINKLVTLELFMPATQEGQVKPYETQSSNASRA